jgi:hypothetical protein
LAKCYRDWTGHHESCSRGRRPQLPVFWQVVGSQLFGNLTSSGIHVLLKVCVTVTAWAEPDGLTRAQPLDVESSQSCCLRLFPEYKPRDSKEFHLAMSRAADTSLDLGASPVRASESTNRMVADGLTQAVKVCFSAASDRRARHAASTELRPAAIVTVTRPVTMHRD